MNTPSDPKAKSKRRDAPTVPRDRELDDPSTAPDDSPRAAADANPRDEEIYTDREKPLVAGSREARALHDNPPRTKGTLDVGTAGDAARPSKPGIHGKPLPPRGDFNP